MEFLNLYIKYVVKSSGKEIFNTYIDSTVVSFFLPTKCDKLTINNEDFVVEEIHREINIKRRQVAITVYVREGRV